MEETVKIWKQIRNDLSIRLKEIYHTHEADSIAKRVIEELTGKTGIEYLSILNEFPNRKQQNDISRILKALMRGEPLQYIFGYADFYNQRYKVNEHTLIPRQETEELVDRIIKDLQNEENLLIADIGTGSGCIITSLSLNLSNKGHTFWATDFKKEILEIASENANIIKQKITFAKHNLLTDSKLPFDNKIDILVSNPPYVTLVEKKEMHKNVLENEPHSALFVPQDDPLIFYKKLAEYAEFNLTKNGRIYLEINEMFGEKVSDLFRKIGMKAEIIKDLNNKDRIVFAKKM